MRTARFKRARIISFATSGGTFTDVSERAGVGDRRGITASASPGSTLTMMASSISRSPTTPRRATFITIVETELLRM